MAAGQRIEISAMLSDFLSGRAASPMRLWHRSSRRERLFRLVTLVPPSGLAAIALCGDRPYWTKELCARLRTTYRHSLGHGSEPPSAGARARRETDGAKRNVAQNVDLLCGGENSNP